MIIDLSIPVTNGMKMFASFPAVRIEDYWSHEDSASKYLLPCRGSKVTSISMVDHTGTHVDSPAHFIKDGRTISDLPVDAYSGLAVLLDVSSKGDDQILTVELFEKFLDEQKVELEPGIILILKCTKKKWDNENFLNVEALHEEVAEYLISKKIKAIGLDLMAVDSLYDMRRPVHMRLLDQEVLIIEGLANLELLPTNRFQFFAFPLLLKNASGSPVRAVAILD